MSKQPKTGEKPESYNPPVAIPPPVKQAAKGLMAVDPKKLPSKQPKPALGEPLPKPAPAGQRKVVTKKTGAKGRRKEKGKE